MQLVRRFLVTSMYTSRSCFEEQDTLRHKLCSVELRERHDSDKDFGVGQTVKNAFLGYFNVDNQRLKGTGQIQTQYSRGYNRFPLVLDSVLDSS